MRQTSKLIKTYVIIVSVMFLVTLISGCISQAPKVVNPEQQEIADEDIISSELEYIDELDQDISDSELESLDQDLSDINWT